MHTLEKGIFTNLFQRNVNTLCTNMVSAYSPIGYFTISDASNYCNCLIFGEHNNYYYSNDIV